MIHSIGLPTKAAHLRLLVNPVSIERTPRRCSRDMLQVYVRGMLAMTVATCGGPAWVDGVIADLERRTNKGTIASGTYTYVPQFPRPDVLRQVNDYLAGKGITLEIQPHASDDGTFMAWVQYDRQVRH